MRGENRRKTAFVLMKEAQLRRLAPTWQRLEGFIMQDQGK